MVAINSTSAFLSCKNSPRYHSRSQENDSSTRNHVTKKSEMKILPLTYNIIKIISLSVTIMYTSNYYGMVCFAQAAFHHPCNYKRIERFSLTFRKPITYNEVLLKDSMMFILDNENTRNLYSPTILTTRKTTTTSTSLSVFNNVNNNNLIMNDVKLHDHSVTIAGTLWPVLRKLYVTRTKMNEIIQNVKSITEWQEIIILPFLAFALHPIIRFIFYNNRKEREQSDSSSDDDSSNYKNNLLSWYNISLRFGQIGQVALSVYLMDVIPVILTTMGFQFPNRIQLSSSYMKIAYTTLFISRLLLYKKVALCKVFGVNIKKMGQIEILNRFLNGIIVTIGALFIFDWLSVKMGKAVTGIFAYGSVGAVAFTLASEGLVKEILSGIVLIFGNKLNVGDKVIFGDGTPCTISKIGWLETMVHGSDNIETRVPNTELASKTVSNISRTRRCQVKQTFRFRYDDAKKIPQIISDIKQEIIDACPELITDKSIRLFRVYWTDFKEDHLEVMVDTHHNIAPSGDEYWMNRQKLLTAILRAVEKNYVELQHESS